MRAGEARTFVGTPMVNVPTMPPHMPMQCTEPRKPIKKADGRARSATIGDPSSVSGEGGCGGDLHAGLLRHAQRTDQAPIVGLGLDVPVTGGELGAGYAHESRKIPVDVQRAVKHT